MSVIAGTISSRHSFNSQVGIGCCIVDLGGMPVISLFTSTVVAGRNSDNLVPWKSYPGQSSVLLPLPGPSPILCDQSLSQNAYDSLSCFKRISVPLQCSGPHTDFSLHGRTCLERPPPLDIKMWSTKTSGLR